MRIKLFCVFLPLLLVTRLLAAEPAPITIENWGTVFDPDEKCAVVIRSHRVAIQVPAGAYDLSAELRRTNAPRILQEVRGDFVLEVEVDGAFKTGEGTIATRTAYNGAGLLIWQDELNYLRLERAALSRSGNLRHYVNFEQRINGRLTRFGSEKDYEVDETKPCKLRLERKGQQILGFAKQGEAEWQSLGVKSAGLPMDMWVGVAAINASDAAFEPVFTGLTLEAAGMKKLATPAPVKVDPYEVPEGDVDALVAFIRRIKATRPRTAEEYRAFATRGPAAMTTAAERILKQEDAPAAARELAQRIVYEAKVRSISNASEEDQKAFIKEIREFCESATEHGENGQLLYSLARSLEYAKKTELAAELYLAASETMKKSDDEAMLKMSEKLAGAARRMNLLGNSMEIRGKLTDGKDFDLESYRGKVVLVDFWATWCGPCVAELPNVKKHYALYHDKGFEVVGVCLDSSREKLEAFVEARDIPWVNLFEDDAAWEHPVANQYGIMAIPTVILINAEGKVVSLKARGPELGRLLEEELGPVDPERLRQVEEQMRGAQGGAEPKADAEPKPDQASRSGPDSDAGAPSTPPKQSQPEKD